MFDLLIVGGWIVDGSGNPRYRADVGLIADRIASIGQLASLSAARVIDATGLVLAPGFIDPHCHSEIGLLAGTCSSAVICQGVTTHVLAPDGFGCAPLAADKMEQMRAYLVGLYGKADIGWDWCSLGQYLARFEGCSPVNVVGQVSHHAVRLEVMGWSDRPPTTAELDRMLALTRAAMDDGAVGLATGLDYFPGGYADTAELITLCRAVAERGGLYTAHQRHSFLGTVLEATRETLRIGTEAGIAVHISHLYGDAELFQLLEQAREAGVDVTFDAYPYTAGAAPLILWMPRWAQVGDPAEIIARLGDPEVRRRLRPELVARLRPPAQWDTYLLAGITGGRNAALQGHSLAELVGTDEQALTELVCDLLIAERLQVVLIDSWLTEDQVRRSLTHPLQIVMSDGTFAGRPHPRAYGTYPRVLGRYVREERLLSLEDAVRRMTSLPAQRFCLHDRGLIKCGLAADLTLFDPDRVVDRATYTDPEKLPEGIPYVLVNGRFVVDKYEVTGAKPGRVLKPLILPKT